MKLLNKIFLISFIALMSLEVFGQECTSQLTIRLNEKSSITINNETYKTDFLTVKLEKGIYEIKVEPFRMWGRETLVDTIIIETCDSEILYNYSDYIYLDTDPQDASVYYADSLVGYTPLFLLSKIENVTLRKEGYKSSLFKIKKDISNFSTLEFIGKEEKTSFLSSALFKILLGNIIVLGGTAAYFKIEADKNYDNFIALNDNSFLEKTRQYDIISGIALGVLQINFGVLLYFLLFE